VQLPDDRPYNLPGAQVHLSVSNQHADWFARDMVAIQAELRVPSIRFVIPLWRESDMTIQFKEIEHKTIRYAAWAPLHRWVIDDPRLSNAMESAVMRNLDNFCRPWVHERQRVLPEVSLFPRIERAQRWWRGRTWLRR
jgi:hypothetical protein